MREVNKIRKENLEALRERYKTLSNLNVAIGKRKTDSTLSQILNGARDTRTGNVKNLGDRLARTIEEKLSLGRGWLDCDHTGMVIPSIDEETYDTTEVAVIPVYAGGGGMAKHHEIMSEDVIVGDLTLSRTFLKTLGYNEPDGLTVTTGYGDSMRPTILPGAKILVDSSIRSFSGNGIYLLEVLGNEFIKRLTMKMNGQIVVSTDNPVASLSEYLDGNHEVQIRGKVIYYWNGFRA